MKQEGIHLDRVIRELPPNSLSGIEPKKAAVEKSPGRQPGNCKPSVVPPFVNQFA